MSLKCMVIALIAILGPKIATKVILDPKISEM